MAIINVDLSDNIATWRNKTNQISTLVGDLTTLNTSEDSDLVGAINDLKTTLDSDMSVIQASSSAFDSDISSINTIIGTLASLNTTDKSSIVDAINEVEGRIINVYDNSGTLLN